MATEHSESAPGTDPSVPKEEKAPPVKKTLSEMLEPYNWWHSGGNRSENLRQSDDPRDVF